MKILKFGIKNTLFGCFGQHFLKKYSHIWNQHSRIFLISNWVFLGWNFNKLCHIWNQRPRILLLQKQKFLNLDSKMPCLGFYGSRFQKLLPYLKSAPSNLSYSKILYKNFLYLGPKIPDFGIFRLELPLNCWKTILPCLKLCLLCF